MQKEKNVLALWELGGGVHVPHFGWGGGTDEG